MSAVASDTTGRPITWPKRTALAVALAALCLSVTYPGHVVTVLPYLALLACPLMMLVMCSAMKKGEGSSCDKPNDRK